MSSEHSYEQSVYSNTPAISTPGSDTPSGSETMSNTSTLTADFQISSPVYRNTLRSFQDLGTEIVRLEVENKRLVEHNNALEQELETLNERNTAVEQELVPSKEHNTAIKKELECLKEHNTAIEKELEVVNELNSIIKKESATLKEENDKLSRVKDDAMKKLAEVEEKIVGLEKELDGLGGLKEVLGWKKKCEELETRATQNQQRIENMVTKHQKRMEKLFEDYQKQTEKRIADIQHQIQQNQKQNIKRIKDNHTLDIQDLARAMGFKGLEDVKNNYIVRNTPYKTVPSGMIQVSLGKVEWLEDSKSYSLPREDKNTRFLYVVRDLYTDFQKFTNLAESTFGFEKDYIRFLKGTKSGLLYYGQKKAEILRKWEKEASKKDRVYITQYCSFNAGAIYYIEN